MSDFPPAPHHNGANGLPTYGQTGIGQRGPEPTGLPSYGQPFAQNQGGYGQGGYGGHLPPQNGLGLAGMICGIVGAVLALVVIGIIPAILGIIFGAIGIGRARRGVATNRGQSLTGIITGIVGVLLAAGILTVGIINANRSCADRYNTNSRAYQNCVDNGN